MPKITMREEHFAFLRKLLWDAAHNQVSLTGAEETLAEELLVVFGYTRYFRAFSVEIEPIPGAPET
jgi:hypothetical protein